MSILDHFHSLSPQDQDLLLKELSSLDLNFLNQEIQVEEDLSLEPLLEFDQKADPNDSFIGEKCISEGKAACVLLAGGQGTRLSHTGPKGTYPVSPIQKKSLFQLVAEKVKAASLKANRPLLLAIM